jgi:hypothetical protein
VIDQMLRHGTPYHDLGPTHFDQLTRMRTTTRLVKRLRELGYHVQLSEATA